MMFNETRTLKSIARWLFPLSCQASTSKTGKARELCGLTSRKTVVVNALSLNLGGGRSIRDSYLKLLNDDLLTEHYVVIIAKGTSPVFINNPMIKIIEMPAFYSKTIMVPLVHRFVLGHLVKKLGAEVVLNFCDVIMRTDAKQIYLLDFPYVLNVHCRVFVGMEPYLRLLVLAKGVLHRRYFHEPEIVVAQTELARDVLKRKFGLRDIRVISNAVTLDGPMRVESYDFSLPDGVRLLYPATYHPHKNLEIFIDVAEAIKARGLNYRIVTTINPNSASARRFIAMISERGLEGIIANLGHVPLLRMRDLYSQCDGVLMPTLLESFSIVYLETMYHGLPILTSDLDFARAVCGEGAMYFDPLDPSDILQAIEEVFTDESRKRALIEAGARRLKSLPTWPDIYLDYKSLIHELIERQTAAAKPAAFAVTKSV